MTGLVLAVLAITYVLVQQRMQRRMLRQAALVSVSPETAREIEPHLAVLPTGAVAVAWTGTSRQRGVADRIGVRVLQGRARALGPIAEVTVADRTLAHPVLVAGPSGDLWLVFLATRSNEVRVFVTHSPAEALAFDTPRDISKDGERVGHEKPSAVLVGDRLVIAYRTDKGPRDGVAVDPRVFSRTSELARALCASKSRMYTTWIDPKGGVVLEANDDGPTFQTTVSRAGEQVAPETSSCVAEGDEVTVLYGIAAGGNHPERPPLLSGAIVARSNDGGRTFDARTEVREANLVLLQPAMAREASGATAVVYYAGRDAPDALGAVRWNRIASVGDPATPAREVRAPIFLGKGDSTWLKDSLRVATAPGHLFAAFVDNADGNPHIAFAELGP